MATIPPPVPPPVPPAAPGITPRPPGAPNWATGAPFPRRWDRYNKRQQNQLQQQAIAPPVPGPISQGIGVAPPGLGAPPAIPQGIGVNLLPR